MTYTFKLSRRLAVSHYGLFALLTIGTGCAAGDAVAPTEVATTDAGVDARDRDAVIDVTPDTLTLEVDQSVRFTGRVRSPSTDTANVAVEWSATGGNISSDGTFTSSTVGSFKIVGRGRKQADTSVVVVVAPQPTLASITLTPTTASVVAGATQQFATVAKLSDGSTTTVGLTWTATGGSIDAAGKYTAGPTAGQYQVIVANTDRTIADTAAVTVTVPAPVLSSVVLTPASYSLLAGTTKQLAAYGRMSNGDSVAVAVTYSATGGTIASNGLYTAGSSAGTYRVIAAAAGGPADTAAVTVTVPAPVLTSVVLTPASYSLTTGTTKQFAAYGRMSNGDSVAVAVTYSATGGTIASNGLYTAGSSAGTYRVIAAAAGGPADTAAMTLNAPVPSGTLGVPFGAYTMLNSSASVASLNLSIDSYSASDILTKISSARTKGLHLFLAMTGGAHSNYLTNGVFDRAKWNAKMDTYNTSTIKSAIAAGVADGTILGASVMDEPNVSGAGDGNTWGPVGTMTKLRVDSLCSYVKNIFPTLPTGVVQRYDVFEPTKSYRVCGFMVNQYSSKIGSVSTFRDGALAMGQRDGMAIVFSLNVLDGGTPDLDGTVDCIGTGGVGTYGTNCRMTAQQVRDFGKVLGAAGCALLMWQYDSTFMTRTDNLQAFSDVASLLSTLPAKSCTRVQ
jgi:hypothetical protein